MQTIEVAIYEVFKNNPGAELTTTDVLRKALPDYEQVTDSSSAETLKAARSRKAKLQRFANYYLKKLVRDNQVTIVRKAGRTHECVYRFVPGAEFPEYQLISKPYVPPITALGVEEYEEQGSVARHEPSSWITRVNAVLLETAFLKTLKELSSAVRHVLPSVNDVIGINDFETIIQTTDAAIVLNALHLWDRQCQDSGRKISLVIDVTNVQNEESILRVVKESVRFPNITYVYDAQVKEFNDHKELFKQLIKVYTVAGASLFVKNQTVHQSPYLLGKAGPYTFSEIDWKEYKQDFQGKMPGLVCGMSTFLVDIHRLFEARREHQAGLVIELMGKIAKSFLRTNAEQQEHGEQLLPWLVQRGPEHAQNYFRFARNYVRFWNYGWKTPAFDQEFVTQYLGESKKAVDEYCISEETIYKSCGLMTRFRIAYSCTDQDALPKVFTPARYQRVNISNANDFFHNNDIKDIINTKQAIFRYFDGGDRITFDRGVGRPDEVINEMSCLLTAFTLPFFRYKFSTHAEASLLRFL